MYRGQFSVEIVDFEAEDVRAFYDSNVLRVWHLVGKDRTVRIAAVKKIVKHFGKTETKTGALLFLTLPNGNRLASDLPLELNATNRDTIRRLYGSKPRAWVGRLITLYPTTTEVGNETRECIRIRPWDPDTRQPQRQQRTAQPRQLPAPQPVANDLTGDASCSSGPAVVQSRLDAVDRAMGNVTEAEYQDVTDDPEEPPPGALETDAIPF